MYSALYLYNINYNFCREEKEIESRYKKYLKNTYCNILYL